VADQFNVLDQAASPIFATPTSSNFTSTAAWEANRAVFAYLGNLNRSYRHLRFHIGTASGNIQIGVVRLDPANHLNYTRVMSSGIIACPAAATISYDLGATALTGDHALFFWADNATVTTVWGAFGAANSMGFAKVDSLATGVLATGSVSSWQSQEAIGLIMLEAT
jgi:hypothetical protein